METLNRTTQDQMNFSYVLQKSNMSPYTLPDGDIHGDFKRNDLFVKYEHGCWYRFKKEDDSYKFVYC